MRATRFLPDDVVDAIVRDQPVDPTYAPLVVFARQVRAVGAGPAPRPSPQLAALLEGRTTPDLGTDDAAHLLMATGHGDASGRPGRGRAAGLTARVAGLGLVAKIGLGASIAAASVTGAGAAGVLPAAANDTVRHAIEAVSPVEFTDRGDDPSSRADHEPIESPSSRDPDGQEADDGPAIADDEPEADHRPDPAAVDEPPGQSGETGLTRANETPGASHAPDAPPSTTPGATSPSTTPGHPDDPGQGHSPASVPSTVPAHGDQADAHIPDL
jgi:hypothetical protein